jgi:hypothetical protein
VCTGAVGPDADASSPLLYFAFLSHLAARVFPAAPRGAPSPAPRDAALLRRLAAGAPAAAAAYLLAVEPATELALWPAAVPGAPDAPEAPRVVAWMRDGAPGGAADALSGVPREKLEAAARVCACPRTNPPRTPRGAARRASRGAQHAAFGGSTGSAREPGARR